MVSVVKDSSSDLAQIAKNGSALLLHVRESSERSKMKQKFWVRSPTFSFFNQCVSRLFCSESLPDFLFIRSLLAIALETSWAW